MKDSNRYIAEYNSRGNLTSNLERRGGFLGKKRILLTCLCLIIAAGCANTGGDGAATGTGGGVSGFVLSAEGTGVAGATVYLVPTTAIDMTQITGGAVFTDPFPAEDYDEPLEDTVASLGAAFVQAVTGAGGSFNTGAFPDGSYYVYVEPPAGDTEHLPGGSICRTAFDASALRGQAFTILLSSSPSAAATYTGTANCLTCHPSFDTVATTAHKIGIMPINAPGVEQDPSKYSLFLAAIPKFKSAATFAGGTRLELGDYDPTRSFDKFKIREFGDAQMPITTVFLNLYLWKSTVDGKYYITVDNMLNAADPNDLLNIEVKYTYGGAVGKQRYLVSIPAALGARNALYFTLQYNTEGSDARLDRARRVWRDYKFSNFWGSGTDTTYGTADDVIKAPPTTQTFEGECAACHFTGYKRYTDGVTGELRAEAANNVNGEGDVDGDIGADEMNIGCEVCHGPGSEHAAANNSRYIVVQSYLSPERENVTCGRCHDRPNGKTGNEQAINDISLELMRPGESRATFLADFTATAKKGPNPASELWADGIHSKSHHQQYSDFLKSKHYKNEKMLVTCADCHDVHGGTDYRHQLLADPDENNSFLCQRCHTYEAILHMEEQTGSMMTGMTTNCIDCHMPKTAQSGSGRYGLMVTLPPFANSTDEKNKVYWENDTSAHVFQMPNKNHISVAGQIPGNAMPIPYTNSCGSCHNVNQIQFP